MTYLMIIGIPKEGKLNEYRVACQLAVAFGNKVNVLDIDYNAMIQTQSEFPGNASLMFSNLTNIRKCLAKSDVIINCILWPKTRKDHLINRQDLKKMKKGAMIIDVACDEGGAIETCRSTSHSDPIYYENGILHYCVDNLPSAFSRTASVTLSNVTLPYANKIAKNEYLKHQRRIGISGEDLQPIRVNLLLKRQH